MSADAGAGQTIDLFLLGGVELKGIDAGAADRLLAQPKITALLAFLALSPQQRPQRRDRIVALLWPELDQAHARTALRKAVHALRASLGAQVIRSRGDEEIGLMFPPIKCDAVDLADAAENGRMLQAVNLYRGELLPGFFLSGCVEFERWLEEERSAARERAAAAAWGLARTLESENKNTDAGLWARKAVHYTSWEDERVLRRTITMLARIGDYAGAIKLYEEFAKRMKEYEGLPAPETKALVARLREYQSTE